MRAVLLIPIVLGIATHLRAASPTTQTGTFTTKFTERSPTSAPNELARRFGEKQAIPEYDLSQHEFLIHVPSDYDGSKPMGVVFLLLYKDTTDPPAPCLPMLAEKRLIFVVPKEHDVMPPAVRCGLVLDALHNLKLRYAIDDKRVFLFATYANDFTNQRIALSCGDVFSGLFISEPAFYRQLPAKGAKSFYPPRFSPPPTEVLGKAKLRAVVLSKEHPDDYTTAVVKGFQGDGFKRVKLIEPDHESLHYPNLDPKFIAEAIEFMEPGAAKGQATTSTTRPAPAK